MSTSLGRAQNGDMAGDGPSHHHTGPAFIQAALVASIGSTDRNQSYLHMDSDEDEYRPDAYYQYDQLVTKPASQLARYHDYGLKAPIGSYADVYRGIDSSKWKYAEWIVDSGATCMLVPPAFTPYISNKCESNMTIGGFTKEGTA